MMKKRKISYINSKKDLVNIYSITTGKSDTQSNEHLVARKEGKSVVQSQIKT